MRRFVLTLGACLAACAPHVAPPRRAAAPSRATDACGGAAPRAKSGKVRPFVDLPLQARAADVRRLLGSPDGRVVAIVGKDDSILFDAARAHALRVVPFPVLGWADARHVYRRAEGAIMVVDVDPDAPMRRLPDRATDRLPVPVRGAWLERSERGDALVDARGELLFSFAHEEGDQLELLDAMLRKQLGTFARSIDGDPTDGIAPFDAAQPSADRSKLALRAPNARSVTVYALDDPSHPRELGRAVAKGSVLEAVTTPDGRYVVAHVADGFAPKEDAVCNHRLVRMTVTPAKPDEAWPPPSEALELATFEPQKCFALLPVARGEAMLLAATDTVALCAPGSAGTIAYELANGRELWFADATSFALAPGGRVLTVEHHGVVSRDLVNGRGAPLRAPRVRSHDEHAPWDDAAFVGGALVVDYGDGRAPTAWSLSDASAAPASDAQRAALVASAQPAVKVPESVSDSEICGELPCRASLMAAAPERDAVVLGIEPRSSDMREVDGAIQFRALDGTVRKTVELEGVLEDSAQSRDHRRVAALVRAPSQMFGTPIDRLPWRADVYDTASGDHVDATAEVSGGSSVGIAPDGGVVFVGARDGGTFAFARGKELWRASTSGGEVQAILVAPDGSIVVTGSADAALRVFDARTGALRATLAEYADGEWIAATPGGAFTGTPEVAPRVGYVFEPTFEFFGLAQLPDRFRDERTVRRRLAGEAVDLSLDLVSPPQIALAAEPVPSAGHVRAAARSDERVDVVRAYVDGRLAGTADVCRADGVVDFDLPLLRGTNRVSLVAFDDRGLASNTLARDVVAPPAAGAGGPAIRWLSVGISKYPSLAPAFQLPAATKDATAIADALRAAAGDGKPFASASGVTLLDEEATPSAIEAALARLADAQPDDLVVVFFAGHGVKAADAAEMRFVTGLVRGEPDGGVNVASIPAASVGWAAVGGALERVHARALVLLDACHAGHMSRSIVAPNDALAESLVRERRAGAIVFAAAKGRQASFEAGGGGRGFVLDARGRAWMSADKDGGHGYFTGALLGALGDPATDRDGNGAIEIGELIDVVTDRVDQITHGEQTPWVVRREMFGDFAIAAAPAGAVSSAPPSDRAVAAVPPDAEAVHVDFGGRLEVLGVRVARQTPERIDVLLYVRARSSFGPGWELGASLHDRTSHASADGEASGATLAPNAFAPGTVYELARSFAIGADWKGREVDLDLEVRRGSDVLHQRAAIDGGADDDATRVARIPRPRAAR